MKDVADAPVQKLADQARPVAVAEEVVRRVLQAPQQALVHFLAEQVPQILEGHEVEITIHEGKNRQVRKMFEAVGCNVRELKRISMGSIYLSRLAEGHYRKLTKKEIEYLRNI